MKKKLLLVVAISTLLLTACGNKVKFTTEEYKQELLAKVYTEDAKAKKEYDEIIKKLEKQMADGKKEAVEEMDRWKKAESIAKVKNVFNKITK